MPLEDALRQELMRKQGGAQLRPAQPLPDLTPPPKATPDQPVEDLLLQELMKQLQK